VASSPTIRLYRYVQKGEFLEPLPLESRVGFRKAAIGDELISKPSFKTIAEKPFTGEFLIDRKINLGRYVLNHLDRTIFR